MDAKSILDALFASSLVVNDASPVERAYLDQLQDAMKLDQGLVDQIRLQMNG